ncbi:GNAT family N-acetyltransferase [Halobaculum magnesiiphilum]|uniref:GNAT family N-acetyltransferase n=1 Tax=Halobaculum magnesiiphilum TaxID=1017351 RepID=A0A8T8WCX6_9EURY|nr:N-acetyltransferase [Halobaculum magnesiiphilum]QZP37594.1 GNAT family N-acetyltransferase [Halobaculum magnesiiphilum]
MSDSGEAEDADDAGDPSDPDATIRPYEPNDADALWGLKRGFETGLGDGTGGDAKAATYEAKLTEEYRRRWLDWVDRCVDEQAATVTVAAVGGDAGAGEAAAGDAADDDTGGHDGDPDDNDDPSALAGYVFVLPESLSFVWDAAVLNEVYVRPEYRGTGVADDLMEAALSTAREQDLPLDRMVLDVDRENERAQAFYERYGFEHWGEMVARDL